MIELLVVIAIIAILASILFPVFSRAREMARRTACLNNEKQLSLAVMQYVQDFDETLPSLGVGPNPAGHLGGWIYYNHFPASDQIDPAPYEPNKGSIYPYVKNAQLFVCPDDSIGHRTGNTYAMNACGAGSADATTGFAAGKALAAFNDTSNFLVLCEEVDAEKPSTSDAANTSSDDGYLIFPGNDFSTRHMDGSNIALLDGHAKYFKPEVIRSKRMMFPDPDDTTKTTCP